MKFFNGGACVMLRNAIVLLGGGGHCEVVLDAIRELNMFDEVMISDMPSKIGERVLDVRIEFTDEQLEEIYQSGVKFAFVTLGMVGVSHARAKLYRRLKEIGFQLPVIVSKSASVSRYSLVGEGTFIGKNAVVNAGARIGENCIINTGAIIEHDCVIEAHSHIAPGAILSGGVHVGENSFIGAGAVVLQGVRIAPHVLIGAGAVVLKDADIEGGVYVGNPARLIKINDSFAGYGR
jgi:UDP-perosamine 4-acetyltransferase